MRYTIIAIFTAIVIILVAGGAYYFGQKSIMENQGIAITPTPTTTVSVPTSMPSPTPNTNKTLTSGGVLVFSAYSVNVPKGWDSNKEQGQNLDKVILTKGSFKITIAQFAGGGGGCTYPGDQQGQFTQNFSTFSEINDPNGFVFRRGVAQTNSWTVCQKNTTDGSFGFPTSFGFISIDTPSNPSSSDMAEVDSIIASLKKQI